MTEAPRPGTILICAIHRTTNWWKHVGAHFGYERVVTMTDVRGDGDICVVDDFYASYGSFAHSKAKESALFTAEEVIDVIARCRVLRWMPKERATAMVLAMAEACARVLDRTNPVAAISFPIDRYPTDLLARLARKRGIPYYEFAGSALGDLGMLMFRGRLIRGMADPDPALVEAKRAEIADPLFSPAYAQVQSAFTVGRFLRIFGYFRLRGWIFRLISMWKRDPLNFQYLDAQHHLGHKPRIGDAEITRLVDPDWRAMVEAVPHEKRMLMGLQLFPEASIDYWIENLRLLDYEPLLLRAAGAFSQAGFTILVKDHPLQYGFRQVSLIKGLREIPGVVVVPYDISGNELMALCDTNFTLTGTLGLQSALLGLRSIVVPNYYSNSDDFIEFSDPDAVEDLPRRVAATLVPDDLKARQSRIVSGLLKGSFHVDFFTFRNFKPNAPNPRAAGVGRVIGEHIHAFGPEGEDWHRRQGL